MERWREVWQVAHFCSCNAKSAILSLLIIYCTEGLMFYLCYLFVYFLLLIFKSQNWRMGGSGVFYEQSGVRCKLNITWLDSLPRHPVLEMGKLPKMWRCLYLPNGTKYENRKMFFEKRDNCSRFWWKMCKSFTNFGESMVDSWHKFHWRASITLPAFTRWHRYWVDSSMLWRMTQ